MPGFYGIHIGYIIVDQHRLYAMLRFSCDTILEGYQGQMIFSSFFITDRLEPFNQLLNLF